MKYNSLVYSEIGKRIELEGYLYEEFDIGEGDKNKVSKKLEGFEVTSTPDVTIIYIVSLVDPQNFFCIYETSSRTCVVYSPGEFKIYEKEEYAGFKLELITSRIKVWLGRMETIKKLVLPFENKSVKDSIRSFVENVDNSKISDTEFLSENEIDQVKSMIDEMEKKYEVEIEKLKSSSIESDESISLLNDELRFVKDELDRIKSRAQIVPKKKWSKETFISLQRIAKKYPNTIMYLTVGAGNPEIPLLQKVVGTGIAMLSDGLNSDVSATDIIDQQNPK